MKRLLIILCSIILVFDLSYPQAPDSLTLEECHQRAIEQYPLSAQFTLLEQKNELEIKKLNTNYLPHVNINGQASYQSEVTKVNVIFKPIYLPPPINQELPAPSPVVPYPPKDQYKFNLNIDQVIYDGGITANQKKVELANHTIERQNVEIELYRLKQQINHVFFSITLLQESELLLQVLKSQIGDKLKDIESAVKYGMALESDHDVLAAELMKIEQQMAEVIISKEAAFIMLQELTSSDINPNTHLVLPEPQVALDQYENKRLEYALFDLYKSRNEAARKLVNAQWMPKVVGYGQLGYGQPGLNMMDPRWDTYYIFGARLNWNIWNWNKYKKESQVLDVQNQIINTQKESFDKNIKVATAQDVAEVKKYEYLILKDNEIIKLRNRVAKTASSQLDNGVITSTDYIQRVNDATQAEINMKTHEIQLIQAKINYLATVGKL
ncbi:MAG: TolC family protein [Bacteroidota bacterium]|nr:TolC family protein [Bacteroidota bacterium]